MEKPTITYKIMLAALLSLSSLVNDYNYADTRYNPHSFSPRKMPDSYLLFPTHIPTAIHQQRLYDSRARKIEIGSNQTSGLGTRLKDTRKEEKIRRIGTILQR